MRLGLLGECQIMDVKIQMDSCPLTPSLNTTARLPQLRHASRK
jgi:hypothetical protein